MADVRDGEIIAARGIPKHLKAYRHPDGVYLWDEARNRHAFCGADGKGIAPAFINMGYGSIPWVNRWAINFTKRQERERNTRRRPRRNTRDAV